MLWTVLTSILVIYALNTVLSLRQMRNFSDHYTQLRRRGRVAIGKQKNALTSGAIVMFLLDDGDRIVDGCRLRGLTVLARFKNFHEFDGQVIDDVDPAQHRLERSVRRAVANARDNVLAIRRGDVPEEPPSPLMKVINRIDRKAGTHSAQSQKRIVRRREVMSTLSR